MTPIPPLTCNAPEVVLEESTPDVTAKPGVYNISVDGLYRTVPLADTAEPAED